MNIEAEKQRIRAFFSGPPKARPRVAYERWYGIAREACGQFARRAVFATPARDPVDLKQLTSTAYGKVPCLFGGVTVAAVRQQWPTWADKPMIPLLQINCTTLPFRPRGLEDIDVLTVFGSYLDANSYPYHRDLENGESWLVRSYSRSHDVLTPAPAPARRLAERLGFRQLAHNWPNPSPSHLSWSSNLDQPSPQSEAGEERALLIQMMLYRHYQASAGEHWAEYERDAGGNNWGLFTTEINATRINQVLHPWTRNLPGLKLGGWPTYSGNEGFPIRLPATLDVPSGYEFVFQIPDLAGWSWNTSATDVTMALFFRDMTSTTPRWAMFRRRQT